MDKKLYINPPLVKRAYDWKKGPQPKTRKELEKFFNSPAINKVKDQICEMGRRIYARGYTDGNGGNLSVRVGEDLVLCTPTLCCKGFMKREDICLCDMDAGQLCGYRPRTSEVKVHIAMMKTAGWNACVHCHPPHCNAFLFAGLVPPSGIWLKKMSASGLMPLGGTCPAKRKALQCGGWQWTQAFQPAVFIIAMCTFTSLVRGR